MLRLPRWIAHRGGGALAPENTLAGIRLAAALGFRAVEFDVMLSGDETPVLIHDETLARTTNGDGWVCRTSDIELFALDAGGGERIPHLGEALALCAELGILANVEIKPAAGHDQLTAEVVCDLLRSTSQSLLISSFSRRALSVAGELLPSVPRAMLYEAVPANWTDDLDRLQFSVVHCSAAQLDTAFVAEAAQHGLPVACYTVNQPAQAEFLFASGVQALFTDCLDRFAPGTPLHPAFI